MAWRDAKAEGDTDWPMQVLANQAQEWKWYDYDTDMKRLSLAFPSLTFCLHGEGEESDDLWNRYYRNGKCQVAKATITYAPFDKKQLR